MVKNALTVGTGTINGNGVGKYISLSSSASDIWRTGVSNVTWTGTTQVIFALGNNISLPQSSFPSVTFISSTSGRTITLTGDLTVANTLNIYGGAGLLTTMTTNSKNLNVATDLKLGLSGQTTQNGKLIIDSSTLTVASVTIYASAGVPANEIVTTGTNPIINCSYNWTNSDTFTNNSVGLVKFNRSGSNQTVVTNAQYFYNLEISNTNADTANDNVIISGNLNIDNDLTITDGELQMSGSNPAVNIAGDMSIALTGNLTKGTGTWTFNGTTPTLYTDNSSTKQNLGVVVLGKTNVTASNNLLTLGSSMTVDDFTLNSDNTFDLGNGGFTFKLTKAGSTATVLTVNGTFIPTADSTVEFSATNSGGDISIPVLNYDNLTVSGSETYDLTGNLTGSQSLTGNVTVSINATLLSRPIATDYSIETSGDIIVNGTYNISSTTADTIIKALNITINSGGTLNATSSTATIEATGNWDHTAGTFTAGSSTVKLSGNNKFVKNSGTFYNLQMGLLGNTTELGGEITISNVLTTGTGTVTSMAGVGWGGIVNISSSNADPYVTDLTTPASWGAQTQTVFTTGIDANLPKSTFNLLILQAKIANHSFTLGGDLTITNRLDIYATTGLISTLDTNNHNVNITYDLQVGKTAASTQKGKLIITNGSVNVNRHLVIFDGAGDNQIICAGTNPTLTVKGNWTNSDTFTSGGVGTIVISTAIDLKTSTILGDNTFNNLTIDGTAQDAKTVQFEAGKTQTVTGTVSFVGGNNQQLTLTRNGASGVWNLDIAQNITSPVQYISVYYGVITDSHTVLMGLGSTSDVNSSGWIYPNPAPPTGLGPTSLTDESWTADTSPTFTFTITKYSLSSTVKYHIQVCYNVICDEPIIDYYSTLGTQGSKSFTVGQTLESGTYYTGGEGLLLNENNDGYFWRVQAVDPEGYASSYANGFTDAISSFKLDNSAPTNPSTPNSTAATQQVRPTWTWEAGTDSLSGMNKYYIKIGSSIGGSEIVSETDIGNQTSWTYPTFPVDGYYYFNVKAEDVIGNQTDWINGVVVQISSTVSTTSNQVSTVTPIDTNITLVDKSSRIEAKYQIEIGWEFSPIANLGITTYNVVRDGLKIASIPLNTEINSYLDSDVSNQEYNYQIEALNNSQVIIAKTDQRSINLDISKEVSNYNIDAQLKLESNTDVIITWKSQLPALGQVEYGISKGNLEKTQPESVTSYDHSVTLENLKINTPYFFKVITKDNLGQTTTSQENTFKINYIGETKKLNPFIRSWRELIDRLFN